MVPDLTEKVYGMGAGNVAWVTHIVVAKMPLTSLFIMRFGDVTSMQKEHRSCRDSTVGRAFVCLACE